MLWAVFTLIAAAAQTARNAMQRELTATLGTVGATHVRFLFGFPFALVFLAGVVMVTGAPLPRPGLAFWPWVLDGFLAQIAATALMLAAMNDRSFVVTIAYIKTEPVQVALFGFVLLGDKVTPLLAVAIANPRNQNCEASAPMKPANSEGRQARKIAFSTPGSRSARYAESRIDCSTSPTASVKVAAST